jgi:dolichyl-phosphate beta-glucosyltransferase
VVIPAFNESGKIARDVEQAAGFCVENRLAGEIIVVDDGGADDTSGAARRAAIPGAVELRVIRLEQNSGKGFAVRTGILSSRGDVVLFADAGSCVPFRYALPWIARLREGDLDVAVASRRHRDTVILRDRPRRRRALSRLFHWAAVAVAGLPRWIGDSQCGFKLFRGDVGRELFAETRTSGFLFDVEVLLRAVRRNLVIAEFPVEWSCDLDTRLRPRAHAAGVIKDLFKMRALVRDTTPAAPPSDSSAAGGFKKKNAG